jgi:hypothetical protein
MDKNDKVMFSAMFLSLFAVVVFVTVALGSAAICPIQRGWRFIMTKWIHPGTTRAPGVVPRNGLFFTLARSPRPSD